MKQADLDLNTIRRRSKRIVALTLGAILLYLPVSIMADVVYVPRSELFGFIMGQQIGRAVQGVMDMRVYAGNHLAGYAALEQMRQDLAACGDCAGRASLVAEIAELQAYLIDENGPLCAAIDVVKGPVIDNAASMDAVGRLTGMSQVCESYKREVEINDAKISMKNARENFDRRVKAGDVGAYSAMGDWIRDEFENSRAVSREDRHYFSCSYFMEGARKGDVGSLVSLPGKCWLNKEEYREVSGMLVQCVQARRKEDRCAHELETLAYAYSTARSTRRSYPMEADDREALRLRQAALAYWEKRQSDSPQDAFVRDRLASARQQSIRQQEDVQPAPGPETAARAEIHTHLRKWCEGIRERSGRAEMLAYDCACFVRETDRHISEGRIVWTRVQRDGMFDFGLIEACVDRSATADAWVAHQRTLLPATGSTDRYLACAHGAIARDLPLEHLSRRYAAGWKGVLEPKCATARSSVRSAPTRAAEVRPGRAAASGSRRCDNLRLAVERAQAASVTDPGRYASRYRTALAQYERACGG